MKAEIAVMTEEKLDENALDKAGQILQQGGLVAFPTETVYGLGGDALDPAASKKIYAAKGRPSDNPLIIHIADMGHLQKIVKRVPEKAKILAARCWPGPLTMIFEKSDCVPYETTGGLESVAVRMPVNRIAQEVIRRAGGYVAAPSANTSGRPSPTMARHVIDDLSDKVEMIIDGGMTDIGLESTIVDFTEEIPTILRPGYLNQQMLEEVIGEVRLDPGILSTDSNLRPKAPGMRYKHYAPRADLAVVEGSMENVVETINTLARNRLDEGAGVGIICTDETFSRYPLGKIKSIGARSNEESIAMHLYQVLRAFDEEEVDYIYSESFDTPRMGQAIMNRLLKAAGHEIIEA
ncbi:MAG TPA: threonylcarbamoyl-AMP synthase [Candidatus Pelethocola excrementipullorum]|nr:threonylcarbamoyl-AMP synthase [Candidatus Pelethocola excrementipullorum]